MGDERDINFQSTERQKRILPEDSFGDWKWREALAELMVPLIGSLYRDGVNLMIYGKSLVNESPVAIMKAHRFARQSDNNELSEFETYPMIEYISTLNLHDCEIDIGEIAVKCPFFDEIKEDQSKIKDYLNKELESVIDVETVRPDEPKSIVLYGFGRIGRLLARMMTQTTGPGNYFRIKAIVIRKASDDDIFKRASLLSRDSVHGPFDGTVRVDEENTSLVVNGNAIKVIYASSPDEVKYADHNIIDPIVIDNTGVWRDEDSLSKHLKSGASKVILTAPAKGDIKNIVFGINDDILNDNDAIISAASCTTNAIVPVLNAINDEYSIEGGHIETVHAYTNDQNLIDNYHPSDRRGRSAALNLVITDTGAAKAVSEVLPELKGKLTANAIRVPTPNVSLAILNLTLKRGVGVDEINDCFRKAAFRSKLRETIDYTNSIDAVSSDFYSNEFAVVYDSQATISNFSNVTIYCWYDNEYGYTKQVVRLLKKVIGAELTRYPKQ